MWGLISVILIYIIYSSVLDIKNVSIIFYTFMCMYVCTSDMKVWISAPVVRVGHMAA